MEGSISLLIIVGVPLGIYLWWDANDRKKYPNKFRGLCGYCNQKHEHGRNKWWLEIFGEKYCVENGLIFLGKDCIDNWKKENTVCNTCHAYEPYTERTISHKYKRNYYYFCSSNCKATFREENPELFHEGYHRHSIPSDLRKIIWKRDGGKCVKCGSDRELEYDHIIPVTKGGATSEKNLELLCSECNRSKSAKIE